MLKQQGKKLNIFRRDLFRALKLAFKASAGTSILNVLLVIFQALLPIVSLYLIKILVEMMSNHQKIAFEKIIPIIIGFCFVQLLTGISNQLSLYISNLHQQKLMDYMAAIVLDKAISVKLEYYENAEYYDNLHLAQQQSMYRVAQLLSNFNAVLLNCLSLIFLTGLFISLYWVYAILFVMLSLPVAIIKWYYAHKSSRLEMQFVTLEREASYLHQTLTSVNFAKEVRTLNFGVSFIRKFKKLRALIYDGKKKLNINLTTYSSIAEALELIMIAIIFIMLAKRTWEGIITVGVFVVYLQGFQKLQSSAKSFLQSFVQIFQQRLFLRDLFFFLDIPTKKTSPLQIKFPEINEGLFINNLTFKYPGTDKIVLENINIKCPKNGIVAIVGENGSGKSTLVKLLAQLYDIQSGHISLDKTSLSEINDKSFRENTVFLFQDFEKYFFTVEENITLGSETEETDQNKLKQSAQRSGAHHFIKNLSQTYQTRLGRTFSKSEQLSGGQWQKLALTRIFYKNAKLLVLDEPTSAIDAISEHELFIELNKLAKEKMIVLISHRLYNIKLANYIYVMHEGRIIEEGDFNLLITKNGMFREMYDKQKLD